MQHDEKQIKLSKAEERQLLELGLYAHIETAKQDLEAIKFKQEQGI